MAADSASRARHKLMGRGTRASPLAWRALSMRKGATESHRRRRNLPFAAARRPPSETTSRREQRLQSRTPFGSGFDVWLRPVMAWTRSARFGLVCHAISYILPHQTARVVSVIISIVAVVRGKTGNKVHNGLQRTSHAKILLLFIIPFLLFII